MFLYSFGTFAKKLKKGFWRCNSSKTVRFKGHYKDMFKELGHRNLTSTIGTLVKFFNCAVLKSLNNKINIFCKDPHNFA